MAAKVIKRLWEIAVWTGQCCRFGDRLAKTPYFAALARRLPTSPAPAPALAPNRNPEKEIGDVGQQPAPAGRSDAGARLARVWVTRVVEAVVPTGASQPD